MKDLNNPSRWHENLGAGDLFEALDKLKSKVSWKKEGKHIKIEISSSTSHERM